MEYFLKQFDKPLLKFSATTDTSEPEIQILWIDEENRSLVKSSQVEQRTPFQRERP